MSWETIGMLAMSGFFLIVGAIEGRRRFGEARFDTRNEPTDNETD